MDETTGQRQGEDNGLDVKQETIDEIIVSSSNGAEVHDPAVGSNSLNQRSRSSPQQPQSVVLTSVQRRSLNLDPRLDKNNKTSRLWTSHSSKKFERRTSESSIRIPGADMNKKNNMWLGQNKSLASIASSSSKTSIYSSSAENVNTNAISVIHDNRNSKIDETEKEEDSIVNDVNNDDDDLEKNGNNNDDDEDEDFDESDCCCSTGCWPDASSSAFWTRKIEKFVPITNWLRHYDFRQNVTADILVGITVAIFQVPQSMGYCLIANVPPVHGLYTAFFPPLIYAIFGTSRHCSVGAFALVSGVMTGHLVQQVTQEIEVEHKQHAGNGTEFTKEELDAIHVSIATSASLCIGVMMLLFGLLRLGFVSIYLSSQSISGFCCAASIYVFTSQLGHLTGKHHPARSGFLAFPLAYYDLFKDFNQIHPLTAVISLVTITLLAIFKCYLNPKFLSWQQKLVDKSKERKEIQRMRQECMYGSNRDLNEKQSSGCSKEHQSTSWNPLPFPIELIVVIVMTAVSGAIDLKGKNGVEVVGEIRQGMPSALVPELSMLARVFFRSIPLAVVGFAITLSIGRLFGGKHGYTVDPNQELLALGLANIVGSSFGCLPSAASLPRSAIQENTGGKTQLVSLINCAALLVVILLIGSMLQMLPNCILASIISVALIGLISQSKDLLSLWRVSRIDGLQWLVSFLSVVIFDVDIGLYIGTGFSLLVLVYKSSRPKTYLLGSCTATAEYVYVPIKFYRRNKEDVREKKGIKVYQFCGPLHFSSKDFFKRDLLKQCGLKQRQSSKSSSPPVHHVIIDCSMFSYIDSTGLTAMKQVVQEELQGRGITAFLASCAPHVVQMMSRDDSFFKTVPLDHVFVSVHDAVLHAMDQNQPIRVKNNNIIPISPSCDSGFGSKDQHISQFILRKGSQSNQFPDADP